MDDKILKEVAAAIMPPNMCMLTNKETDDPIVMHRDLCDWWPPSLQDMRDDRVENLLIVDRMQRDHYYDRLSRIGIVLAFSGGLDSTTVLHWALKIFGKVHCLIFDYGQRHSIEIESAKSYIDHHISESVRLSVTGGLTNRLSYEVVDMSPINKLAESALTRDEIAVPEDTPIEMMSDSIPITFVPGRNVYFTTALAQVAYREGWRHIALGVNILDYSGYPDCRPEFLEAMRVALRIGIFNGTDLGVHAPLMYLNKKQIIRLGWSLGVDYSRTHSCYDGTPGGCGTCDSCQLRRRAFEELGGIDPAISAHQ